MLAMSRNWLNYMTAARRTAWGIPQDQYNGLANLSDEANAMLQKVQDDAQRTTVVTAQCNLAFKALDVNMRFFKKHYLLVPPLTEADLVAMGLGLDSDGSPIPPPQDEAEADLGFPDYHLIEVLKIRRRGIAAGDPRSYHGVRIHIGILNGTGPYRITEPPLKGEDLPWSKFTRRHRERFDLEGNSGKEIFISLCYENAKGERGPFGPIIKGIVP
jgi:hypothetical protein